MPDRTDTLSFPISLRQEHRLFFTRGLFSGDNGLLETILVPREPGFRVRALVFWDAGLAKAFPDLPATITAWFAARNEKLGLVGEPVALPGGEGVKNDFHQLENVWSTIEHGGLCRHSYVIAIGGGATLDMVGFAAATAHRGISLVRVPTTSLSQGDGGVGVKNGVNYFGKKNWLGSFGVPHAVVNDLTFLQGLPLNDRRAGLIEAVKVALIRDAAFFEFIASHAEALANFQVEPFEAVIRESARQHIEHIATAGDPFERGSARPLDFGHWAAHKLEQLSSFQLSHGEAVAIGMALDLVYARRVGLLPLVHAERILALLVQLGFTLSSPLLDAPAVEGQLPLLRGLEEFREHLGGRLTIPMIKAPGVRLDVHEMDLPTVAASMDELRSRYG